MEGGGIFDNFFRDKVTFTHFIQLRGNAYMISLAVLMEQVNKTAPATLDRLHRWLMDDAVQRILCERYEHRDFFALMDAFLSSAIEIDATRAVEWILRGFPRHVQATRDMLRTACEHGSLDNVNALLDIGRVDPWEDVDTVKKAIAGGNVDVLKTLVRHPRAKPMFTSVGPYPRYAFFADAVREGNVDMARIIMTIGEIGASSVFHQLLASDRLHEMDGLLGNVEIEIDIASVTKALEKGPTEATFRWLVKYTPIIFQNHQKIRELTLKNAIASSNIGPWLIEYVLSLQPPMKPQLLQDTLLGMKYGTDVPNMLALIPYVSLRDEHGEYWFHVQLTNIRNRTLLQALLDNPNGQVSVKWAQAWLDIPYEMGGAIRDEDMRRIWQTYVERSAKESMLKKLKGR